MTDRPGAPGDAGTAGDSEALQARLGYAFADPGLLESALIHASLAAGSGVRGSNERLEFLGDRVLGLIVAHRLFERFADDSVGELARRHSVLVSRETLAAVALGLGLDQVIRLARSEEEGGGRANPAVLADACEAVIAAIYLDGGLGAAQAAVERLWRPLIEADAEAPKDAKTALQEWAQGQGLPLPVYEEVERDGPPHAPRFTIRVHVDGQPPAEATGPSKRQAARAAAEALLSRIKDSPAGRRGRR